MVHIFVLVGVFPSPLEPLHDDLLFVYYSKLYYDKFCSASVRQSEDSDAPSASSSACSLL
jgi:hypothetical protein